VKILREKMSERKRERERERERERRRRKEIGCIFCERGTHIDVGLSQPITQLNVN